MGTKKRPFYRLVVADSRSPRDGRFIEAVGYYDPLPTPATVQIDAAKVKEWIGKGARPSDAARSLLVHQGILPKPPHIVYPPKPEPEKANVEEKVAEAPAEPDAAVSEPAADAEASAPDADVAEPVAAASTEE